MVPISAAVLKKDLFKYLDKTIVENEVLNVSTPNGDVIILNAEAYRNQLAEIEELETAEALKAAADDIESGRVFSHEEVFAGLQAKIDARKAALAK